VFPAAARDAVLLLGLRTLVPVEIVRWALDVRQRRPAQGFRADPAQGDPRANVLASVPGTQEAADAVLLAQVPTTAVVNKEEAEKAVSVKYAGEPKFAPIQPTEMSYATNTQDKVIKVGDLLLPLLPGVWFMSTKPSGPWKTCDIRARGDLHDPGFVARLTTRRTSRSPGPTATTVTTSLHGWVHGLVPSSAAAWCTAPAGTNPPYVWYGPYPYPIYWSYP
jgi:hypothetical protein